MDKIQQLEKRISTLEEQVSLIAKLSKLHSGLIQYDDKSIKRLYKWARDISKILYRMNHGMDTSDTDILEEINDHLEEIELQGRE